MMNHSLHVPAISQPLLEHIPGLRLSPLEHQVYGPIDALHIARFRLGLPMVAIVGYTEPFLSPYLRDYQKEGVAWLLHHLKRDGAALLADDMGLGKTLQTITVLQALAVKKKLIICPGSVRLTWENELRKWDPSATVTLALDGESASSISSQEGYVVTSYELAMKLPTSYQPDALVIDEAHLVKGRMTARSKRVDELAALSTYRIALSGTPVWSRPKDFWKILQILFRKRFGTADEFDFAYCGAYYNEFGGKENKGISREDELRLRLQYVMLRREKRDVAKDLPPVTSVVQWLPADERCRLLFQKAMMTRNGAQAALEATLKFKMERAINIACESKQFVLFTWMKKDAVDLHKKINDAGTPCVLITGDVSVKQRKALVEAAKAARMGVVATIDAISTGVDGLQAWISTGIFHALDYTPTKIAQAVARLDRIGQQLPVTMHFLAVKDSMDQRVVETVIEKMDQWRKTMGTKVGIDEAFSAENSAEAERQALLALYEDL